LARFDPAVEFEIAIDSLENEMQTIRMSAEAVVSDLCRQFDRNSVFLGEELLDEDRRLEAFGGKILLLKNEDRLKVFSDIKPIPDQLQNGTIALGISASTRRHCIIKRIVVTSPEELRDYRLLGPLECPSIIQYFGISISDETVLLYRPFYQKGDLTAALGTLTDVDRHIVMYGIAKGLIFLHRRGIVHGNLHPSNVLLSDENEPVIIGFPLSATVREARRLERADVFCAPELISKGVYTQNSDIYAYGMLLHSLFSGDIPKDPKEPRPRKCGLYRPIIDFSCRPATDAKARQTLEATAEQLLTSLARGLANKEKFKQYAARFGDPI
jgi:serine/threonine protein kinase